MTTDELRALDERIARALGWFPCPDGWARMCGPNHDTSLRIHPPRYSTDAALLSEMWAECERQGWFWTMDDDSSSVGTLGQRGGGFCRNGKPVTSFALAFDAAIQAQGEEG